jgi:hypothetical protein
MGIRTPWSSLSLAAQAALSGIDIYLLVLLVAAWKRRDTPAEPLPHGDSTLRFVILIPAHDEEQVIGATLAAVERLSYPRDRRRVVVIADNCSDGTAAAAARAGATVLERREPDHRGKGHALNWALDRLDVDIDGGADAIAILDADCVPSLNWLTASAARLGSGARAVQASYIVANPEASAQTALRAAAFALMNTVRPMGKDRLGLSSGLLGTGMVFARELLEARRFNPDSLAEDSDLHLRLVCEGERVAFASEASVLSDMPTSPQAIDSQQRRWEGGRSQLIRDWSVPLLRAGLRHGDPVRIHAALEHFVPPQSVLALAHVCAAALTPFRPSRVARRLAIVNAAMQILFVLGGLRLTRAPRSVYGSLLAAPVLVVKKVRVLVGVGVAGAPRSWERTSRG